MDKKLEKINWLLTNGFQLKKYQEELLSSYTLPKWKGDALELDSRFVNTQPSDSPLFDFYLKLTSCGNSTKSKSKTNKDRWTAT